MTFSDNKIGIGIIFRNHLCSLLLAKTVSRIVHFRVDYGEVLAIIEGYITRFSLSNRLVSESDSLLVINNLDTVDEYIFELGALSSTNVFSIFFLHFHKSGNSSAHFLAKEV